MAEYSLENCVGVLQAGGKGTRMVPLTQDLIPKPLLKLGGKPMLEWQVLNIKKYGVREFVIIVGHLGEMIEEYFGDGSRWDVSISFVKEDIPLGSGGALSYLKGKFPGKHIIMTLGDVMFDMDIPRLIDFHEQKGALATLVVHPNSHPYDSDLVVLDENGCVTKFDAKTNVRDYFYDNCVNAGVYVIEPEVLDSLDEVRKRDLEKEILLPLLEKGKLYGYRTTEYLKDAGTVERFSTVEKELSKGLWERRNLENPQRCVFLDRDGTLNRYKGLIYTPEQIDLEDHAAEAIGLLNTSGYLAMVVTNQPVVARGMCSLDEVRKIHYKLGMLLGEQGAYLDDIAFCPHHPDKGYPEENPDYKIDCSCRKPKTGMIDELVEKYHIDRNKSWIVGDTTTDIECGRRAGLKTVLVKTGEAGGDGKYEVEPDFVVENVLSAVKLILEKG